MRREIPAFSDGVRRPRYGFRPLCLAAPPCLFRSICSCDPLFLSVMRRFPPFIATTVTKGRCRRGSIVVSPGTHGGADLWLEDSLAGILTLCAGRKTPAPGDGRVLPKLIARLTLTAPDSHRLMACCEELVDMGLDGTPGERLGDPKEETLPNRRAGIGPTLQAALTAGMADHRPRWPRERRQRRKSPTTIAEPDSLES